MVGGFFFGFVVGIVIGFVLFSIGIEILGLIVYLVGLNGFYVMKLGCG